MSESQIVVDTRNTTAGDRFVENRPLLIGRFPLHGSVRRKYLRGTQQLPMAALGACRIGTDQNPDVVQLLLLSLIHGGSYEV